MKTFKQFLSEQEEHDGDKYFSHVGLTPKHPNPKSYAEMKAGHNPETDKVIHMHPDHFLAVARNGDDPEKHATVKGLMDKGTKFNDLPTLHFTHTGDGHARVTGHEGRHRARALSAAGVKSMPVVLSQRHNPDAQAINWKDHSNFHDEWPHTLHGERGPDAETSKHANNEIPFPVKDPRK